MKEFHYWEINRGRYLCTKHGGFCDSSDGYAQTCPACGSQKNRQVPNPVDRLLQLVNNLQGRSKRNAGMTAMVLGGAAGLGIIASLDVQILDVPGKLVEPFFFVLGLIFFILSVLLFTASMRQIPVATNGKTAKTSIEKHSAHIEKQLEDLEFYHAAGAASFGIGGSFFIISLSFGLVNILTSN